MDLDTGMFGLGMLLTHIATNPVEHWEGEDPYSTQDSTVASRTVVSPIYVDIIAGLVGGSGGNGASFDAVRGEKARLGGGRLRVPG